VTVVFWAGFFGLVPVPPVLSWVVFVGLVLTSAAFVVVYWTYAIGMSILGAILVTYREAARALARGEFGYFTRVEGSGPLTVLVTLALVYLVVTFVALGMSAGEVLRTAVELFVYAVYAWIARAGSAVGIRTG